MMRCILTAALSIAYLLSFVGVSSAQVTIYVTPTNQTGEILEYGAPLYSGDQITFDIAARNDGTPIAGLGISAVSYLAAGLEFDCGFGVPQLFAICIPDLGCGGGLEGLDSPFLRSEDWVQVFNHISLNPTTSTGEGDWGPNGIAGEAQARVIFNVTVGGIFQQGETIAIGTTGTGDALVVVEDGDVFLGTVETIWVEPCDIGACEQVVPEPSFGWMLFAGVAALAGLAKRDA